MEDLLEIRLHGRGGQGAKTAAQLVAEAAMETGRYIQAFPEYGPERAGAPMRAFVRVSKNPINLHCGVLTPDVVMVIDPSLLETEDVTQGLKGGTLLVNTHQSPDEIRKKIGYRDGKVATVDATGIALDTLKLPMTNIPMIGALLKVHEIVSLDDLTASIQKKFTKKIGGEKTRANIDGLKQAYQEVKISGG
ncbi:MAG: 2-oxoacid:acceptor oxidoreductase family protein [Spirochaetota bacterium]